MLRKLAQRLSKDKRILFAYVYGSILRRRDARDIDLAVYLGSRGDTWLESQGIAGELEKAIGHRYPVDVHALNEATAAFAFRVLQDGRLIWERGKERRQNWEAHTLSRYQDLKPMLDFYDRKFLSR